MGTAEPIEATLISMVDVEIAGNGFQRIDGKIVQVPITLEIGTRPSCPRARLREIALNDSFDQHDGVRGALSRERGCQIVLTESTGHWIWVLAWIEDAFVRCVGGRALLRRGRECDVGWTNEDVEL